MRICRVSQNRERKLNLAKHEGLLLRHGFCPPCFEQHVHPELVEAE